MSDMSRTSGDEQYLPFRSSSPHPPRGYDAGSAVYIEAWDRYEAQRRTTGRRRGAWRVLREGLLMAVLAVVLFIGTRSVAHGREVRGPSTQPTYHSGQRILIARHFFGSLHRGDVIVFKPPVAGRDDLIKRVIGVPGDHIVIRGGRVWVNGTALDDLHAHGAPTSCAGRWCDVTLGPNEYYVMGDNRANSSDSRIWGPVTRDRIEGKAWLLYYPFGDFRLVK